MMTEDMKQLLDSNKELNRRVADQTRQQTRQELEIIAIAAQADRRAEEQRQLAEKHAREEQKRHQELLREQRKAQEALAEQAERAYEQAQDAEKHRRQEAKERQDAEERRASEAVKREEDKKKLENAMPRCKWCGNSYSFRIGDSGYLEYCSRKCAQEDLGKEACEKYEQESQRLLADKVRMMLNSDAPLTALYYAEGLESLPDDIVPVITRKMYDGYDCFEPRREKAIRWLKNYYFSLPQAKQVELTVNLALGKNGFPSITEMFPELVMYWALQGELDFYPLYVKRQTIFDNYLRHQDNLCLYAKLCKKEVPLFRLSLLENLMSRNKTEESENLIFGLIDEGLKETEYKQAYIKYALALINGQRAWPLTLQEPLNSDNPIWDVDSSELIERWDLRRLLTEYYVEEEQSKTFDISKFIILERGHFSADGKFICKRQQEDQNTPVLRKEFFSIGVSCLRLPIDSVEWQQGIRFIVAALELKHSSDNLLTLTENTLTPYYWLAKLILQGKDEVFQRNMLTSSIYSSQEATLNMNYGPAVFVKYLEFWYCMNVSSDYYHLGEIINSIPRWNSSDYDMCSKEDQKWVNELLLFYGNNREEAIKKVKQWKKDFELQRREEDKEKQTKEFWQDAWRSIEKLLKTTKRGPKLTNLCGKHQMFQNELKIPETEKILLVVAPDVQKSTGDYGIVITERGIYVRDDSFDLFHPFRKTLYSSFVSWRDFVSEPNEWYPGSKLITYKIHISRNVSIIYRSCIKEELNAVINVLSSIHRRFLKTDRKYQELILSRLESENS